jgi:hypothetical protein
MAKRNPFSTQVGRAAMRMSEQTVKLAVNGGTPIMRGEIRSTSIADVSETFSVRILGAGGVPFERRYGFAYRITLTFIVGADGGFWERQMQRVREGIDDEYVLILTDEDPVNIKLNGGSVTQYSDMVLESVTNTNNSDAASNTEKIGTIVMFAREKEPLRHYLEVQK